MTSSLRLGMCVLLVLAVSLRAQSVQPGGGLLAITHVTVIDALGSPPASDMTILVRDGRIASVAKSSVPPSSATIVDGRGRFLIPGLWDVHVHLSYARASALPALVANGVTTIRDMGGNLSEIDEWRGRIRAGEIVGPEILRAGPMLNDQEFNQYQLAVANAADARTAVRTLHKVGVDFIKLHRRTSREAYFAIAEEAKRLDLQLVGHVPLTITPAEASKAGQGTLEHTESLFEGTFATAATGKDLASAILQWRETDASSLVKIFATNGTSVTPTLIGWREIMKVLESGQRNPRDLYVSSSARRLAEEALKPLRSTATQFLAERKALLREFQAVVGMMNRNGVSILAGTDLAAGYIYPGFSLHDELGMLVESGLSPVEAVQAATRNAARLFPKLEAGTIGVGKRADLVLLDANPLEDIRNTQRIRAVIVRGRLLDRNDLDQLLNHAARLAQGN